MIYDDYMFSSLVALIGREPDEFSRGTNGSLNPIWNLPDGRVVLFRILNGKNAFTVFQKEKPPADETGEA
jgi:hypothetical protein